tara:strand:+ start:1825 stop:2610 length:786 start_codon:yes stop_codon:yes gene_type:complete
MKKSQLRNIIRQVIREQRDDFDFEREREDEYPKSPKEPEAMPPTPDCCQIDAEICNPQPGQLTGVRSDPNEIWIAGQTPTVGDEFTSTCADVNNNIMFGTTCKWRVTGVVNNSCIQNIDPNNPWVQRCTNRPPTFCSSNQTCANFDGMQCQECMNPNGPTQQYLEGMVNNQNYHAGHTFWYMLANPGRSYGAYYHQIVHPGGWGGLCGCCQDPNLNPGNNIPPNDAAWPFLPPMTPVCLAPNDPQYQVGYPCDCHLNNTPC